MRRKEIIREWLDAAQWFLPFVAGALAVLMFVGLSRINPSPGSLLGHLEFQGSGSQARDLLLAVTGTVVTTIALVMGLSVVALTTASMQYSPRLLRNFLRDRINQGVQSVFLATFAYCAAGLYVVGIGPNSDENFPRVAVSFAIVLLFLSLGAVVVFSDHLSHSLQVDAIMQRVEERSVSLIRHFSGVSDAQVVSVEAARAPDWSVPVRARTSGYIVTAHPETLLPVAVRYGVSMRLTRRIGEHIVAGRTIADIWAVGPDAELPDLTVFAKALDDAVGIGFERTQQQDVAMGIRQLVDAACKALSPAVNDPYTAVQAIDHMAVIFAELAKHPLGPQVAQQGDSLVIVPSRRFEDYLGTMCGLVRRYGSSEPTVALALLALLNDCAVVVRRDWPRLLAVADQAWLVTSDAKREIRQPLDFAPVKAANRALIARIERYQAALPAPQRVHRTRGAEAETGVPDSPELVPDPLAD